MADSDPETELARITVELASAKAAKRAANSAAWAAAQGVEASQRAAERRTAREERRAANSAAWQSRREDERTAALERAETRRAAKSEQWAGRQLPINDPHVIAMAKKLGKTPEEFLAWQREQQEHMATIEPVDVQMAKLRGRA